MSGHQTAATERIANKGLELRDKEIVMRTNRHLALISAVILAATSSRSAATEDTTPTIECQARPGYHLCQARSEADGLEHEWSVTGDLAINVASGPMASIRCQDGESGALWLQTRSPEGQASVCVEIECGAETTPTCKG
jgi:hypothetical protein